MEHANTMNTLARIVLVAAASTCLSSFAEAKVRITVDLNRQTMHVEAADQVFDWKVSTGKFGYETPNGKYGVLWMDKDHHSDEYDQAPMPDAIFFKPGFAIHGAYKSAFGHPASHGCVRLPVAKAALLFKLVKAQGAEVDIVGESPPTTVTAERQRRRDAGAGDDGPYASRGGPYYVDPSDGYSRPDSGYDDPLFNSVY